jgi:hypothetical protein
MGTAMQLYASFALLVIVILVLIVIVALAALLQRLGRRVLKALTRSNDGGPASPPGSERPSDWR